MLGRWLVLDRSSTEVDDFLSQSGLEEPPLHVVHNQ
jgi:hypothetical protein